MEFNKYDNPKEFVEENEKLILEKEWLNNLMVAMSSLSLLWVSCIPQFLSFSRHCDALPRPSQEPRTLFRGSMSA